MYSNNVKNVYVLEKCVCSPKNCMYSRVCRYYVLESRYSFFWWVLQHCTGSARLVWGRLRVHASFHLFKSICVLCVFVFSEYVQLIAIGVSFLHSQFSIEDVVLYVSFTTFRWKETKEIGIGDWDSMTLQMQLSVHTRVLRIERSFCGGLFAGASVAQKNRLRHNIRSVLYYISNLFVYMKSGSFVLCGGLFCNGLVGGGKNAAPKAWGLCCIIQWTLLRKECVISCFI